MKGPGKYDREAERALVATDADGVLLIILGGRLGSGFSMTGRESERARALALVPNVLREVAAQMERDNQPS